ncbi:ABC transporter ATP-binding protein [Microbacterium arborescens]|uniref:ABC transporter ATP-binding protein n=1 Tax=Microbacterium arborescens TaxID=33883 RepID=UPI00278A3010|nr:ABC transporter ATP-binding protein [Microbacterium arborescens]MDQ1216414.1 ABC-2 type transport system ATP-binding protein [Microbacterium arborescens]
MTDDSATPQHEQRGASPVGTTAPPLPDVPAEVAAAELAVAAPPAAGSPERTSTASKKGSPRTTKPRKPRASGSSGAKKSPRKPRSADAAPEAGATPPKPEIPAAVAAAAFAAPTEDAGSKVAETVPDSDDAAVATDATTPKTVSTGEHVGSSVGESSPEATTEAEPDQDAVVEDVVAEDVVREEVAPEDVAPEPDAGPEPDAESEPQPDAEPEPAAEPELAAEPEPEPDAVVTPDEQPEPELVLSENEEPEPEPESVVGLEEEPEPVARDAIADVEPGASPEPQSVASAAVDDVEPSEVLGVATVAASGATSAHDSGDRASSAPALRLRGVTKAYGEARAVDRIDLEIPAGSFFGLVGPNGAGKTTTLSMIAGLLRPDEGAVEIAGIDIRRDPAGAKRQMGVLPDRLRTFDRLSGRQLLYYYGVLRGLKPAVVENRIADLAAAFDLTDALGRSVSDYSAGMTKKVMLAGAMIHAPRLLVLDEPFESVDPVSSAVILDILQKYVDHGGTVILSSHGMELVQRACSGVAVLVGGRILAAGTVDEVRDGRTLEQRFLELAGGTSAVEGLEWLHTFSD